MEASMTLPDAPRVRTASSRQTEPEAAVRELAAALDQPDIGLVMVFASTAFDLQQLGAALAGRFPGATLVGCSSAGEIGPGGYLDDSLAGVSIHRDDLVFEVALLERLSELDGPACQRAAGAVRERLRQRVPELSGENGFALMLIDGLCAREEVVARAFHDGLGGIALLGGSAGDRLAFGQTWVMRDGRFVSDAALLLVASTPFPFRVFKTQHFVNGDERMVVTGAIPERRVVTEINGCPAAAEYASAIGIELDQLDPMIFAAYPVMVRIGNADFVRSIQKVNPDGSLTFFCAIDEGIVFKVAKGLDMIDNLAGALDAVARQIGPPALLLGCDCILRQLEASQRGLRGRVGAILAESNAVGFSTYGEQYAGMHINQTFVGLAIGARRP